MILAQLLRHEAFKRIEPQLRARQYSDGSESLTELFRREPQWRDTLKKACEAKFRLAEEELEKVCATVREQVGGEYDSEELENEPRIKRARREFEMWEGLVAQCEQARDLHALWHYAMRKLKG